MKEIIFVVLDTNVWLAGINFDNGISRKTLEAGGITIQQNDKKNSDENTTNVEPYYLTQEKSLLKLLIR